MDSRLGDDIIEAVCFRTGHARGDVGTRDTIRPMRIRLFLLTCLLAASFWPLGLAPVSAQGDDAAQILARINTLRQQSGLLPFDLSSVLTAAAQQHSDDMARTGNIDHTGSDGSTPDSRIRDAGYGHWRTFGLWGENIYGGQMANVDAAWTFWLSSQIHRANILKPGYREIGIGVGSSNNGTYYTLDFGAQPNVLPFFVTGSAPAVTLLLTNEDDITTGEGVTIMGQATQVRIAEGTDTSHASWQAWAQSIPFQLSAAAGQATITVEYKDALGRGAKFSRTFNVSDLAPAATPTASPIPTIAATATVNVTAAATSTPAPTSTGAPLATPTSTTQPTDTPTIAPTDTPLPTPTTTIAAPTATITTVPTVTPAAPASPTPAATMTPQLIAAILATYPSASRLTPPAPRSASPARSLFDFADSPGLNTFAIVIGLQVVVLVVAGVIVVTRVRRRS